MFEGIMDKVATAVTSEVGKIVIAGGVGVGVGYGFAKLDVPGKVKVGVDNVISHFKKDETEVETVNPEDVPEGFKDFVKKAMK